MGVRYEHVLLLLIELKSQSTIFQSCRVPFQRYRGESKEEEDGLKNPDPHLNLPQVKQSESCEREHHPATHV